MQFIELDPTLVKSSPWNTNVVSHENEEKLRASIERHGMFKPILVREISSFPGSRDIAYECIGGWHRNEQAVELGYTAVPAYNLGPISDEKAKEISLADNARYGVDDTLALSKLLEDLDVGQLETVLPWTDVDIQAITASVAVSVDDLDLDEPTLPDDDEKPDAPAPKAPKTHQLLKFRVPLGDAQRISQLITETMREEGFTAADDLSNAGDALAFLLLGQEDD